MIKVMQRLFGGVVNEQNYGEFMQELSERFISKAAHNECVQQLENERVAGEAAREAELLSARELVGKLEAEVAELAAAVDQERALAAKEREQQIREHEAKLALALAGAKNVAAAMALLDLSGEAADISEQVEDLRTAAKTAFLFEEEAPGVDGWVGFVPAEAGDLPEEGYAGGFKLRLAKARGDADCLSAIRVKQEAAARGVIL